MWISPKDIPWAGAAVLVGLFVALVVFNVLWVFAIVAAVVLGCLAGVYVLRRRRAARRRRESRAE